MRWRAWSWWSLAMARPWGRRTWTQTTATGEGENKERVKCTDGLMMEGGRERERGSASSAAGSTSMEVAGGRTKLRVQGHHIAQPAGERAAAAAAAGCGSRNHKAAPMGGLAPSQPPEAVG
jgi:hypothetical protein